MSQLPIGFRDFTGQGPLRPDTGSKIKERGKKAEEDRVAQLQAQIDRLQSLIETGPSGTETEKEEGDGLSPALRRAFEEAKVARGEKGERMDQAQVLGLVDLIATARAAGVPADELRGLVTRGDLISSGVLMTGAEKRERLDSARAAANEARRQRYADQKARQKESAAASKERTAKRAAERRKKRLDKALENEQSPDFVGPPRPDGASPTAPAAAAPTTPAAPAAATPAAPAPAAPAAATPAAPAAPAASATPAAAGGIGSFQDVLDMVQDFGPESAKAAAASSAPGPGITKPTAAESTPNTPQAAIAGAGQTPPGMQPQGPKDTSVVDQPLPGLGQNDPSGPRVQGNLTDRDMQLFAELDKSMEDLAALAEKAEQDRDGAKLLARVRKARREGAIARAKEEKAHEKARRQARIGGDTFLGAALEEIGGFTNQLLSYAGLTQGGNTTITPSAATARAGAAVGRAAQGVMRAGANAANAMTPMSPGVRIPPPPSPQAPQPQPPQ